MANPWLSGSTPVANQGANWSDYPLTIGHGISALLSDQGAGLRALGEEADQTNKMNKAAGYLGEAIQGTFGDIEDWSLNSMSDEGKRRIEATMTDPEFWSLGGMTMKALDMSPSIAAVAVPSYLLSGLGLGAATTAAIGGELSATAMIDEMYARTDAMSDAELQNEVPIYKDMRVNGSDEAEARREYNKVLRGMRPLYAAAVGAIANTMGAGGQVARGLSGKAASVLAEEGEGLVKRTAKGVAEGAISEAADEGTQDYLTQEGAVEGDLQDEIDLGQTIISAGTGAVLGGVFGGAAGAAFSGRPSQGRPSGEGIPTAEPSSAAEPSSSGNTAIPGVPDAALGTEPTVDQTTPPTTATAEASPTAVPEPVTTSVVPATGPDAAQTLAIAGEEPAPVAPKAAEAAPVTSEGNTPILAETPEPVARAPEPVAVPEAPPVGPVPTPEAPVARAPEPVRTPEAPSVPSVEGEVRGPGTTPPGPRILTDVTPEGRKAQTEAKRAWTNRVKQNMAEPVEEAVPAGKNFTVAEKETRQSIKQAATEIAQKFTPHADETKLYSKKPKEVVEARNRVMARAKAIDEEVSARGLILPEKFKDAAGENAFNAETLLMMEARRLARQQSPKPKDYERFVSREFDIRSGARDQAVADRRIEGDTANRGGGEIDVDTVTGTKAEPTVDTMNPEELLIKQEEEGAAITRSSRGEQEASVPKSIEDALDDAVYSTPKARTAPVVVEKRKLGRVIKPGEKVTKVLTPANGDKPLPPKLQQVRENIAKAQKVAEDTKADFDKRRVEAAEQRKKVEEATGKMKEAIDNLAKVREKSEADAKVTAEKTKAKIAEIRKEREAFEARVAKAREETNTAPTEAQKETGNYAKGKVSLHGNEISIENPKGSTRSGVTPEGNSWSVKMPVDYGYLKGTKGADGDHIDVFIGPHHDTSHVFVIDQVDPHTRAFDEHKVMMGFKTEQDAMTAYDGSFSDKLGLARAGDVRRMTMEEFKAWKENPQKERAGLSYLDDAEARADLRSLTPEEERAAFYETVETGKIPEGLVKYPGGRQYARPIRSGTAGEFMVGMDLSHMRGMSRALAGTARNVLTKLIGDTPVHVLSREDMARFSRQTNEGAPFGFYAMTNKEHGIFVREDLLTNPQKLQHTIWHEATHAATLKQIRYDRGTDKMVRRLMQEVNDVFVQQGRQIDDAFKLEYGMTDPAEFVAEAFSNPEFQEVLSRMPASQDIVRTFDLGMGVKTMWDALISAVRRALGLPQGSHSLLEAAIRVTERSMHMADVAHQGRAETAFLKDGDPKHWVDELKNIKKDFEARRDLAPTAGNPHLLGLRTLDNIARASDRYFRGNNPIRKIADIIESQRVRAQKNTEKAHPMINKLAGLEKKYRGKQWEDFTSLVHDETMANVFADRDLASQKHISNKGAKDTWAREQHADLAKRYAALPADLKAARQEAMDYFTNAQNELSLKLIRNRIVTLFDTTDPEGLATRIHDGTVTDADKTLMGEAYDAIAAAGSLSKIDGPYFPLMRRGNYVVKGTYKVTEPNNATKISDNEFEFTDKEAAANYMKSQSGKPTMRTIYVDKATGATHGTEGGKEYRYTAQDIDAEPRYRVAVQNRHMEMFDTMKEARNRVAELRAHGIDVDDAVPRAFENYGIQADALSSHMRRLSTVMERRADARNYTPEQKDDLLRTLNEVSLSMLGSTRIQSRNLPRRYVAGASKDLLRNTVEYAHATGNYSAKLDFRPELDAALGELKDHLKANGQDGLAAGRQSIANEVMRRVLTPNPAAEGNLFNAVTNRVLSLSFMDKLMSPTYSVINATQPMMTTTPYLAGQYGIGRAYSAMAKAYRDINAGGSIVQGLKDTAARAKGNLQGNDPVSLIMSRLTNKGELDMMNILLDRGIIDADSGLEVGQLIRDQRKIVGKLDGGIGYLEGIGRQMPKTIEAINRSVSALAAYRLEMGRSGDQARAVQFAQDTVNMTQFNYSTSNSAPWMRHPAARLAFQFKKYGQGMYQMLGEQAAIAVRNENPGDRARAIKSLSYTLGMHAMMAGVMGLPTEPIKLAVLAANGFGLTDWTWDDVEAAEREALANLFGKQFGEMVARGVTRGVGIDLSSRMGLDTMMGPFGTPRSNEAQDWKAYAWDMVSGAPAALIGDWAGGVGAMANGDFLRGAEKLIPIKAVSDSIKAYRGMTEGLVSAKTGKQTMSPYSVAEGVGKALGFGSAREAENYEAQGAFYNAKGRQEGQRRQFQQEWVGATGAAKGRLWRDIQKWNKTVAPEARLSISDMRTYQKRLQRDMKDTKEGIRAKRRERALAKEAEATYDFLP